MSLGVLPILVPNFCVTIDMVAHCTLVGSAPMNPNKLARLRTLPILATQPTLSGVS